MQQNEQIPQSKKYNNERLPKEYKISIPLITDTSLDATITNSLSQQEKIEAVLALQSIHLEWLNIRQIDNLEVFQSLTVLYLQNNKIAKIENLQCLKNLEYLALNDNLISRVENMKMLPKLAGLNLNSNQIEEVDSSQLPLSLELLSFKDNPVCLDNNYKVDIIKSLPLLEVLDDTVITLEERLKMVGKFPQHLLEYSEKMKQFRKKQQIKKQLETQSQPLYLGDGNIDAKQSEKEMREKTRKYMHIQKQKFKSDQKEQQENFATKIKMSRKIRQFKEDKKRMSQIVETTQENDQSEKY